MASARGEDLVAWPAELAEKAWDVCCCVFDLRACKLLEQKLRKGTGTEHWCEINSCVCEHGSERDHCANKERKDDLRRETLSPFCFRKRPEDRLGELLQQITTKRFFIDDHLAAVFESASSVFNRVLEKKQDAPVLGSTAEKAGLQAACLSSALEAHITAVVRSERASSERFDVKDGGKLAYPQSYKMMFPKSPYLNLDSVSPANMTELMDQKWTVLRNWMGQTDLPPILCPRRGTPITISQAIQDDLEWLDMHNLFESQTPFSPDPYRTDSALWLNAGELPPNLKGLAALSYRLTSLPFEMNNKTQAKLSINNNLLISRYKTGSFHKLHRDNEIGENDNGRTFTFGYSVYDETSVEIEGAAARIVLNKDDVLVLKSRSVSYAVPAAPRTRSLVYYWCHGLNNVS